MKRIAIAMMGLLVGCSSTGEQAATRSSAITDVQIERSATSVKVVGLDEQRTEVAKLSLRIDQFVDPEYGDAPVVGRIIEIEGSGKTMTHRSPGQPALELPVDLSDDGLNIFSFLTDARVAQEMKTWKVEFKVAEKPQAVESVDGEAALASCTYGASSSCGSGACFQFTGSPVYQHRCCGTAKQAVRRMCTGNPGGTNACGLVGPLGCSVCWGYSYSNYCQIDSSGDLYFDGPYGTCGTEGSPCSEHVQCCGWPGLYSCMFNGSYWNCNYN